jgi:hypothetical protein
MSDTIAILTLVATMVNSVLLLLIPILRDFLKTLKRSQCCGSSVETTNISPPIKAAEANDPIEAIQLSQNK